MTYQILDPAQAWRNLKAVEKGYARQMFKAEGCPLDSDRKESILWWLRKCDSFQSAVERVLLQENEWNLRLKLMK